MLQADADKVLAVMRSQDKEEEATNRLMDEKRRKKEQAERDAEQERRAEELRNTETLSDRFTTFLAACSVLGVVLVGYYVGILAQNEKEDAEYRTSYVDICGTDANYLKQIFLPGSGCIQPPPPPQWVIDQAIKERADYDRRDFVAPPLMFKWEGKERQNLSPEDAYNPQ